MSNELPSLVQIVDVPDLWLGQLDIGLLNLLCASGQPGAETLDIDRLSNWLDDAAWRVDLDTRRHWYRFIDSPATYHNSPGYFCCYFLLQVLQEEFGVKYNPKRITDRSFQSPKCFNPDFRDSRDLFIHGIIDGEGGTCSSMPVLYVAVARRLGYPVKLVETRGHLFFRWDDPQGVMFRIPERFNIEGAGYGIAMYPDEHYRTWPEPWTAADEEGGWYLKSMSPREELAAFLSSRGECLADNRRLHKAVQAYQLACKLVPTDKRYQQQLTLYSRRVTQEHMLFLEDVTRRRNEVQRRLLSDDKAADKTSAPHGRYCQCPLCRKARLTETPAISGHAVDCQCWNCKHMREHAPGGFPAHSPNCRCFDCQQTRQRKRGGMPGHPPGCPCFHCQSNTFARR